MSKIPPQFREAFFSALEKSRPFVVEHMLWMNVRGWADRHYRRSELYDRATARMLENNSLEQFLAGREDIIQRILKSAPTIPRTLVQPDRRIPHSSS